MGSIQRQTIIFFLPLEMSALTNKLSSYSSASEDDIAKGLKNQGAAWDKRQLYINPQTLNIRDQKIVNKSLTKGGYVVQYWGEELSTIDANGITGSSGVEGINVLRDIYRHEQNHYRSVLANRQRELALAAAAAQSEAESQLYSDDGGGLLAGIADGLTGGAFTKTVKGLGNSIDILFAGHESEPGSAGSFSAPPTLAAFATNIDMYYQGEFFRGYFTSFTVTETAQEPGHFSYQFQFVVTRRTGKRENFMPWHRNPVAYDGNTVMSQSTTESKGSWPGVEMLSFGPEEGSWPQTSALPSSAEAASPAEQESVDQDDAAQTSPAGETSVPLSRR